MRGGWALMSTEDEHSQPQAPDTGARLGTALLVYMVGVTLIVTLLPFHFAWPEQWQVTVGGDAYDFAVSVVLFVPLGFLFRFATQRRQRESISVAVWNLALISIMIEALQLLDPTRVSAILDVVANTLGAWVGALAFDRIARSAGLSGRAIGWLGLEMPLGLVAGALGVAAIRWWQGRRPLRDTGSNRRFEAPLLRSALPLFAVYLAVLIIAPVFGGMESWRAQLGFPTVTPSRVETAQVLELCAAFTLLGYISTELRGREVKGYRDAFPRLIGWGVGLAVAAEAARGFDLHGASAARGALLAAACAFGGWLYYLQRAHVIWLVSNNNASGMDRRST